MGLSTSKEASARPNRGSSDPGNRVLQPDARRPDNFFRADRILREELARRCSAPGLEWMSPRLDRLGVELATRMDALSLDAERYPPQLELRDLYGERQDRIVFHPAYEELKRIAVDSGMFRVKWAPEPRARFAGERHRLGFAAGALYAMGEAGLYCPLCMTDGVARILDRHAAPEDRERLLPRIATDAAEQLATGAMFLTEKAGGSDVGANRCWAEPVPEAQCPDPGPWNRLYGEKWFCSNASAEIVLALARSEADRPGTRGLGLYLIEPALPDGRPNPRHYLRLKDKLGVRSMASAEIELDGVWGKRIGAPDRGFAIMTEMINLSRLYNAVTAVSIARRAIVEAWMHLRHRVVFGRPALDHALVRERLAALGSRWLGEHYLLWHTIQCLDEADAASGTVQQAAAARLRLLTPMVKRSTAEFAVYATRECMELMGGIGYIEQGTLPKLHRDALVLPIWEGAGNIMLLDMLRALRSSDAADAILAEFGKHPDDARSLEEALAPLHSAFESEAADVSEEPASAQEPSPEALEWSSRPALEALTHRLQGILIRDAASASTRPVPWANTAAEWHAAQDRAALLSGAAALRAQAAFRPDVAALEGLMGWAF
jgi:alkylation response protein AidB-like acyl-CoA dehydrogenase